MLKISIVLITRNAQRTLGLCLDSLSGVAGEVVAVDSGSTDRTLDILSQHGVRVFQHEWAGFGPQKNFALEQARLPWVLSLDADEALSPELAREIAALTEDTPFSGFRLPRLNYYFGHPLRHGGQFPDYQLRLFRKGSGRFNERPVHESIALTGRVGTLAGMLEHFSYADLTDYFEKFGRYTSLEAEQLLASGLRPGSLTTARRVVFKPACKFVWRYLFKGGFRDGVPGLLAALFNSMAMVVSYARFWEKYRARAART